MRFLFRGSDGVLRAFLHAKLTNDDSVVLAPTSGVPAILRSWQLPLIAEVPNVSGLHATIHGDGEVHIRENDTKNDIEAFRVPPLRSFASASYFLQILPSSLESYPPSTARADDRVVDISEVESHGFAVLVAVGLLDSEEAPYRKAYPGVDPRPPRKSMRLWISREGRLEVQLAVVWLVDNPPPPAERETWSLVRLPEGGDYLPRPEGGSLTPLAWKEADPPIEEK